MIQPNVATSSAEKRPPLPGFSRFPCKVSKHTQDGLGPRNLGQGNNIKTKVLELLSKLVSLPDKTTLLSKSFSPKI